MTTVARVFYGSIHTAGSGVSPMGQVLALYDENGNLIWRGAAAAPLTASGGITKPYTATLTANHAYANSTLIPGTPSDSSTASVAITLLNYAGARATLTFTYGGVDYAAALAGYDSSTGTYPSGSNEAVLFYPRTFDDEDPQVVYNQNDTRAAGAATDDVEAPVIVSAAQSAKQAIDVAWTASASSLTATNPTLVLQYSTDGGTTWTNSGATLSGLSGTTTVSGLAKNTAYKWKLVATWALTGGSVTRESNDDKSASTVKPLAKPSFSDVSATSGAGTVSWNAVSGAAGYVFATKTKNGSTWTAQDVTDPTASFTGIAGGQIRVIAVAATNSIEYEGLDQSDADNWTYYNISESSSAVNYNTTRIEFEAIPWVNVNYQQIHLDNDVITKKYADERYALAGDAITAATLPAASGTGSLADNGGIVYIADGEQGLTVSSGALSVNFATTAEVRTGTASSKAVTPSSLKLASVNSYNSSDNNKSNYVRTDGSTGKISNGLLPLASDSNVGAAKFSSTHFLINAAGEVTLKNIALTDVKTSSTAYTYGSGKSYQTRTAAIAAALSANSSNLQAGDLLIVSPSVTDETREYTLVGSFMYDGTNLVELYAPEWTVSSVNGKTGAITQAELGLVTDIGDSTNNNDTSFPSSAAVITYVAAEIGKLGGAASCSVATWTAGTTAWNTGGTGLVTANYLKNAISDLELGTTYAAASHSHHSSAIDDSISAAADVKSSETKLVQAKAVEAYAAKKSHTHTSADISDKVTTGQALSTAITASSQLVVAATALKDYLDTYYTFPVATDSNQGVASFASSDFSVSSGAVSLKSVAAADPAKTGYAVKTDAFGQIDSSFIPIDEATIIASAGVLSVDSAAVGQDLNIASYLKISAAESTYLKLSTAGFSSVWSPTAAYNAGDIVRHEDLLYRCIIGYSAPASEMVAGVTYKPGITGVATQYWVPVTLETLNRYATTITGDGSVSTFSVSHPLGVQDVDVEVIEASSGNKVFCAINCSAVGTVQIGFGAAPASGKVYRVIIRK